MRSWARCPTRPTAAPRMSENLGVPVDLTFNAGVLLCNLAEWRKIGLYEPQHGGAGAL